MARSYSWSSGNLLALQRRIHQVLGVADDQEQIIRFTDPVEIVGFGFVAGQVVKSGDLVLEVQRPELKAELQIVEERIHALNFGNRESRATMASEVERLEADLQANLTDLDIQIRRLKGQERTARSIQQALRPELKKKWVLR